MNITKLSILISNEMTGLKPMKIPVHELAQFDRAVTQITNTFNPLIEQLIARRDALLRELQDMRTDYVDKETTRKAAIEELERAQQQMQDMSIKLNPNIKFHEQASEAYKLGLKQMGTHTKLPRFFFSCPTLSRLQTRIAEFGELKECVDYSLKKEPVMAVGKRGKADKELIATGLALDEPNKLIYIADYGNSHVQVVSPEGHFLKRFGRTILREPSGIAVTENSIFVTDTGLHALLHFNKDYKLVKGTGTEGAGEGELRYPLGLCIEYNGDVFVADNNNHRVSVFSKDLKFLKCLGTQQLIYPSDVKVTQSNLVVLDESSNCVHFFSKSGDHLSSFVTQGEDGMVHCPKFFCLDAAGNILITDYNRHNIKILSPSGQLIYMIGKEGHGRGELYRPFGICVSGTGTIFVISWNDSFTLQSF